MQTQEEKAYQCLKQAVLQGEFPPGEFLSQRVLAKRAGTAVVSVRGALRRLENDHLIENLPRWGVRVPKDTAESIQDRYFMREVLEVAAVRTMAGRWSAEQQATLRRLAQECDACQGEGADGVTRFTACHLAFHLALVRCVGSQQLTDAQTRVLTPMAMLRNAVLAWGQGHGRDDHHAQLVDDLLSGNAARAESAVRAHVQDGMSHELAALAAAAEHDASAAHRITS